MAVGLGLFSAVSFSANSVALARPGPLVLEAIGLVFLGVGMVTVARWRIRRLPVRNEHRVAMVLSLLALCGAIAYDAARGSEVMIHPFLLGVSISLSLLAFPVLPARHPRVGVQDPHRRLSGPIRGGGGGYGPTELAILRALVIAGSTRDGETMNHAQGVADLASRLGSAVGLPPLEVASVYWGAMVHDIGKVVVPRSVLRKPGSLSRTEFEAVKGHSQAGADILRSCHPAFEGIALVVLHHHERWDGKGYPCGFREHGIPLSARIVAVADAFEAMTSERPYRRALPVGDAVEAIRAGAGTQFDPDIVMVLERMIQGEQLSVLPPAVGWTVSPVVFGHFRGSRDPVTSL